MESFVNRSSEEPRVLHLISSSGFLGAENVVLEIAREATVAGKWTAIGLIENSRNPHKELAEAAAGSGIETTIFQCCGRFDFSTLKAIQSFINSKRPNIIHSHGYKSNFFARAAIQKGFPWVVTNHLWKRTTPFLKFYAWVDSFLIRGANAIIAVSDEIASEMKARGIEPGKLQTIDNGVNLARFAGNDCGQGMKKSIGLLETDVVIGTIASLTPEKGHECLLDAFQKVVTSNSRVGLVFVGDGHNRGRLEEKIETSGLAGKVSLTGVRRDIPEILDTLDIFVLPSYKEGLPMALLEAMAARRPVIATRVGAIARVIEHRKNGLLVDPGDADALASAIGEYLDDRSWALEVGMRGYLTVSSLFSSASMADRYLSVYRTVLENKGRES